MKKNFKLVVNSSTKKQGVSKVLHLNSKASSKNVSNKSMFGANHIIIESVGSMICGTVMNDILYGREVIEKMCSNIKGNIHAPLSHPQDEDGNFILAGSPEAIAKNYCGAFAFNYRLKGDRLVHDIAINEEIAQKTEDGKELLRRISDKEDIDTSVGILIYEFKDGGGIGACGTPYSAEAVDMDLDHDALLVRERGAATSLQGVGVFANSGEKAKVLVFEGNSSMVADRLPVVDIEYNEGEAIERIKEFTNSGDEPSSNYRRFFLWFDRDNPESYDSYKYPFADIVDGSPVAVRSALSDHRKSIESEKSDGYEAIIEVIDKYLEQVNSKGMIGNFWKKIKTMLFGNELSNRGIEEQMYQLLNKDCDADHEDYAYPYEIFDDYLIYSKNCGKLYKKMYTVVDDLVVLSPEPGLEVTKTTVYTVIEPTEDFEMKEKILAALVKAGIEVEGLTDEQLLDAYAKLGANEEKTPAANGDLTLEAVQKMIADALAASKEEVANEEKSAMEDKAVANFKISKEEAKALSVNSLKSMLASVGTLAFNASTSHGAAQEGFGSAALPD